MRKAIFLDRDGVLNYPVFRNGLNKPIAPWSMEEFKLYTGIKKPLEDLAKQNFHIFVVTNQPDIAKGIIDAALVTKMNEIIGEYIQSIYLKPVNLKNADLNIIIERSITYKPAHI